MNDLQTRQTEHLPSLEAHEVGPDLERLKHLLPSLRECKASRGEAEAIVDALLVPADVSWMMARVAALLLPYYEKDTAASIRMIDAEDWAVALSSYPQWAVQSAVRWWKSEPNANRRKRPLEGDIVARIKIEMGPVNASRIALRSPVREAEKVEPVREDTDEDRARRKAVVAETMAQWKGRG